jgi:hypothetical protein
MQHNGDAGTCSRDAEADSHADEEPGVRRRAHDLREYIEGNVANIARGFGIAFKLTGETDEELAESFLQQMLDGGYARRL